MIDESMIIEFIEPFYKNKDIMHDLSHIKRVNYTLEELIKDFEGLYDYDILKFALYFHGFIYSYEDIIRNWLKDKKYDEKKIEYIIKAAWESQKEKEPETLEGELVHDAHMIEGGKTYLIVKSLITGSIRGQDLEETIRYIEDNIIGKGRCYLSNAQQIYDEQQRFASEFIRDLKEGICMN